MLAREPRNGLLRSWRRVSACHVEGHRGADNTGMPLASTQRRLINVPPISIGNISHVVGVTYLFRKLAAAGLDIRKLRKITVERLRHYHSSLGVEELPDIITGIGPAKCRGRAKTNYHATRSII
jgi:hypothetical protein